MTGWTIVMPVKAWTLAKTRLDVEDTVRTALVRAFMRDVLEAAVGCVGVARVLVVSAHPEALSLAREAGAQALTEPASLGDPLNDAVRVGRDWARAHRPGSPLAVLPSDLAALTSDVLGQSLAVLGEHPLAFVPDQQHTGTTLLTARHPDDLDPAYGPGSARAHARLGHVEVSALDERARFDVDTVSDVVRARQLGLGTHGAALMQAEPAQSAW